MVNPPIASIRSLLLVFSLIPFTLGLTMAKQLVDLEVTLHHQTDAAVLVSLYGERERAVWIPKSIAELEPIHGLRNRWILTLPEQTALDRGLI